jgi:rSAM/selenodomain-associated transferase 1
VNERAASNDGPAHKTALLVFAKAPVPGQVKTRLIPALGADGAARLAKQLIERALNTASAAEFSSLQLWCAPDADHPALQALARQHGATLHVQQGADLGARMHAALNSALRDHDRALLIGTDCPDLSADDLQAMAGELRHGNDVALIPAADGGYVMVGMTQPHAELFDAVDWGTSRVLAQTTDRANAAGLRLCVGPQRHDIDLPEDIERATRALA